MPTINRLQPRKKEEGNQRNENTPERVLRQQFYNTTKWRKARQYHITREPLCQECLKEGRVYAGTLEDPIQVHHKRSPFINGEINWELGLDDNNLETICSYHHGLEHGGPEKTPEQIIEELDKLLQ